MSHYIQSIVSSAATLWVHEATDRSIILSGSNVVSLPDATGNGHVVSEVTATNGGIFSASSATFYSKPTITFNGTNNGLRMIEGAGGGPDLAFGGLNNSYSVVIQGRLVRNNEGFGVSLGSFRSTSSPNAFQGQSQDGAGGYFSRRQDASGAGVNVFGGVSDLLPHVWIWTYDGGANFNLLIDGTTLVTFGSVAVGTMNTVEQYAYGCRPGATPSQFCNYEFAFGAVFDGPITTAEQIAVSRELLTLAQDTPSAASPQPLAFTGYPALVPIPPPIAMPVVFPIAAQPRSDTLFFGAPIL